MSHPTTPHTSINASFPTTGAPTPGATAQNAPPPLPSPATFDILPDLHKLLSRLIQTAPQPPEPNASSSQLSADGPLEIHQLSTAATELKLKIQKARRAVLALPDIDRTCEDQQEEIDDLEERIASMKKVLRGLGQPFNEPTPAGDVSHSKVEEMDEDNDMSMVG